MCPGVLTLASSITGAPRNFGRQVDQDPDSVDRGVQGQHPWTHSPLGMHPMLGGLVIIVYLLDYVYIDSSCTLNRSIYIFCTRSSCTQVHALPCVDSHEN